MTAPLAVVLVSGGLDSCVAAALAHRHHRLAFLHLNYRQRTEARELAAFNALADFFQIDHRLVVDVSYMRQIGGSSLIDLDMAVPTQERSDQIPTTYVPFRNANILGIGVAWAEVLQARPVFIGAHQADNQYPDCRASFFAAYNAAIAQGTNPDSGIEVRTPLIDLDKGGIIRLGLSLQAPLHLTWSCYQSQQKACGQCLSCRLRLQGFAQAGVKDPAPYAATAPR
ncbi:MAG: 7-cyano-7-deazaguanine synthase QueC [Candidatus Latescibacteria bacterium]|nr:7-cyano-7-deazaguanine synthase QueC [Candidatus Latescibacterota bacterium]